MASTCSSPPFATAMRSAGSAGKRSSSGFEVCVIRMWRMTSSACSEAAIPTASSNTHSDAVEKSVGMRIRRNIAGWSVSDRGQLTLKRLGKGERNHRGTEEHRGTQRKIRYERIDRATGVLLGPRFFRRDTKIPTSPPSNFSTASEWVFDDAV